MDQTLTFSFHNSVCRRYFGLLLYVLICFWGGTIEGEAQEVTFSYEPFRPGDEIHTREQLGFRLTVSGRGEEVGLEERYTLQTEHTETILEMKKDRIVRMKMEVSKFEGKSTMRRAGQKWKIPFEGFLSGKTYFASSGEEGLDFDRKQGGDLSEQERMALRNQYGRSGWNLGKKPLYVRKLAGNTFSKRDPVGLSELQFKPFAKGLSRTMDSTDIKDVQFRLEAIEQFRGKEAAVIRGEANIQGRKETEGMEMTQTFPLTVFMTVEVDTCRILKTEIKGPIKVRGTVERRGIQQEVRGSGQVNGEVEYEYNTGVLHSNPMQYRNK